MSKRRKIDKRTPGEDRLPEGFIAEVKKYFRRYRYNGCGKLELEGLQPGSNGTIWAVPRGIAREIEECDIQWEIGLVDIGTRFGVKLGLFPYAYA